MDPVPPKYQTWTLWTWMAYWATDTINLGTWETASSVIAIGLTWRDAIRKLSYLIPRSTLTISSYHGGRNVLRGNTDGSQRCHWRKASYPILGRGSR